MPSLRLVLTRKTCSSFTNATRSPSSVTSKPMISPTFTCFGSQDVLIHLPLSMRWPP